jgi:hypothetical protein
MKIFRIYTENKDFFGRKLLIKEVAAYFSAFTVLDGEGYWQGVREASIIFEIIAPAIQSERIYSLASGIKRINQQEAVLVTVQEVQSELI